MKIKIRALKESDVSLLFMWINDPEIIKFTNYFRPISEQEQKRWFESISEKKDQFTFGIELISENKLIGTCGLYGVNYINRNAELRIKIGEKEEWGKGYGMEAVKQLLDFGFKDINLHRIWLKVLEDNKSAIHLYEKCGFKVEGLSIDEMYIKGNYKNVLLMGLIKND